MRTMRFPVSLFLSRRQPPSRRPHIDLSPLRFVSMVMVTDEINRAQGTRQVIMTVKTTKRRTEARKRKCNAYALIAATKGKLKSKPT